MNFRAFLNYSVKELIKNILNEITTRGMDEGHALYLSFVTHDQGVVLSDELKQKYPIEITIVLQHQFENLKIQNDKIVVDLAFSGVKQKVEIPFKSVTSIIEPKTEFSMQISSLSNKEKTIRHDKKSKSINGTDDKKTGEIIEFSKFCDKVYKDEQ